MLNTHTHTQTQLQTHAQKTTVSLLLDAHADTHLLATTSTVTP